jgi:hypothetical protein
MATRLRFIIAGEWYIAKTRNKFGEVINVKSFITMFEKDLIRFIGMQIPNKNGVREFWAFTGDRTEPLIKSNQDDVGRPRQKCDILVTQKEDILELKKYIAIASGTKKHLKPANWDIRPPSDLGLDLGFKTTKKMSTPAVGTTKPTTSIRCSTAPSKPLAKPVEKVVAKPVSKPAVTKVQAVVKKKKPSVKQAAVKIGDKKITATVGIAANWVCYDILNYLSRIAKYKTVTEVDSLNHAATILINSEFLKLPKDGFPVLTTAGEVLIELLVDVLRSVDQENFHLLAKKIKKFMRKDKFLKK